MHYLYWLTYAASIFVLISISWFGFLINQLSFFYTSSLSLFLLSTLSFYFLNWKQVNFIIIINRFAPGCCTRKLWENLFEKHNFFVFQRVSRSPFLYPTTESFTCIYIYQNTSAKHLKTRIVWLRLQNHELICCLINAEFLIDVATCQDCGRLFTLADSAKQPPIPGSMFLRPRVPPLINQTRQTCNQLHNNRPTQNQDE